MEKHAAFYVIVLLLVLSTVHCQFNDNELYMYFQTANSEFYALIVIRVRLRSV